MIWVYCYHGCKQARVMSFFSGPVLDYYCNKSSFVTMYYVIDAEKRTLCFKTQKGAYFSCVFFFWVDVVSGKSITGWVYDYALLVCSCY